MVGVPMTFDGEATGDRNFTSLIGVPLPVAAASIAGRIVAR